MTVVNDPLNREIDRHTVEIHDNLSRQDTLQVGDHVEPFVEVPYRLAAPAKEPTRKEYKNAMRQFFTVRRPTVQACGHKIDMEGQPNTNCLYCWTAWFQNHGELVWMTDEIVQKHGPETIIRMRGKKYWKFYLRFMAVLKQLSEHPQHETMEESGWRNMPGLKEML